MLMLTSRTERLSPLEVLVGREYSFTQPTNVDLQRIGRNMDGGYLVPTIALEASSKLITFGIGPDWSFEQDFLARSSENEVFAYDFSVSSYIYFEDACLSLFKNFAGKSNLYQFRTRLKRYVDWLRFRKTPKFHFYEKRIYDRHQFSDCITIEEIFADFETVQDCSIIVKCDIDGGEYRIIEQVLKQAKKISSLIMEFHDTGPLLPVFKDSCLKINEKFIVSHIHPNNSCGVHEKLFPEVVEITFLNKALGGNLISSPRGRALHNGDWPCDPRLPEISLDFGK